MSILKSFKIKNPVFPTQISGFPYTIVQCYVHRPLTGLSISSPLRINCSIFKLHKYRLVRVLKLYQRFENSPEIKRTRGTSNRNTQRSAQVRETLMFWECFSKNTIFHDFRGSGILGTKKTPGWYH